MGSTISLGDGEEGRTPVTISIPDMTCSGCSKGVLATLREAATDAVARADRARREIQVATRDAAPLRVDGWEGLQAAG